ncbi:hypothetical protein [Streptomyces sp. NBC_00827]|uniref:hypothetical protein n=1 Tax=Streptomyces sp. NBC_00827 TaxID=2903677 RepID=UPI00386DE0D0|nr:hypothetical protein OG569_10155 [Streptomyces sp. NBC_00827]
MSVASASITAVVALLGVVLGGWLSIRNQDRLWQRDHARQWRDIRLAAYKDFVTAYRQYVAFTLQPSANITAVRFPHSPERLTPFFDQVGQPYKERLETAATTVRLVSESLDTLHAARDVVRSVRQIAASRATHSEEALPAELFQRLWSAQHAFLLAVREEFGLAVLPAGTDDA